MQTDLRRGSSGNHQSSPVADGNRADAQNNSGDEGQPLSDSDNDLDDQVDLVRNGKRKRPISVSCELCKQRKVKCDRGQPSCGWCSRNGASCEYKERKKPGLRAGYGRELEQRLDKLEAILRSHQEILQTSMDGGSSHLPGLHHPKAPSSVRGSIHSLPSDHGTPRETQPPPFTRSDSSIRTPQAETALFLQKPSSYPPAPSAQHHSQSMEFGLHPPTPTMRDGFQSQIGPPAGISPTNSHSHIRGTSTMSSAAYDYYNPTSTASTTSSHPHHQSPSTMTQNQAQIASDHELPPYDLLYALVDLYFKHINTWCLILHRKMTLAALFDSPVPEETDKILLHAIVATTLRYSSDTRLTEESRRRYHDVSKKRVLLYGMENSSVKSLQALVILALDLCGAGNGPPGWNIMALITRSVVQLGLSVESNSFSVSPNFTSIYTLRAMILPEPRDFIEEESRRRLFWMVYLLDRYATISTAFDFALDDKEIDRALPCRDDLWTKNQKVETKRFRAKGTNPQHDESTTHEYEINKPENLGAFSYYIEIVTILSQIHKFLKQPVDISALSDVEQWQMRYKELDNTLTNWKFNLPGEYCSMAKLFQPGSAKTLNCGWVMLHATYHTATIRLHSSAAYPTTRSPIFTPSYSASQRCHSAVENIAALGEFVLTNNLLPKLGPPFAFTLWVAARVLLVHGSTVEHKVSPQIGFFVDALKEMGRYWPVARRYCELLQRVLDEYHDSARHGDVGFTPSSVKILADMRRTAFDLDFLISRQPHQQTAAAHGGSTGAASLAAPAGAAPTAQGFGSRYPSITPARTPQPNELEYLDVFDFFNYPRLPPGAPAEGNANAHGNGAGNGNGEGGGGEGGGEGAAVVPSNEFNITDFIMDVNRDWLFKQEGTGNFVS
uniref:Zn(2)-C6 fungal-type domain-containing protein n=1 Tax=Pyricularia oryzae (strain P131) TaxID=1143193 RepID=L7JKB0_PYRO1